MKDASASTTNHMVCYCDDCQAYLHHLGRADLLDAHGGTDIVQVAPASLSFHRGADNLAGVRLSPKGLYRWYASCCKTPFGNTLRPTIPFVGIVAQAFEGGADEAVGKSRGAILGRYAIGTPPPGSTSLNLSLLTHVLPLLARWRFGGGVWPHPFFDRETGNPTHPLTTLSAAEREALRPLCGPRAAAQGA